MKNAKTMTIESKLRTYMVGFSLLIIISLWLLQAVFLGSFYRLTKIHDIKSLSRRIQSAYQSGNRQDFTQEALNNESHVQIINQQGIVLIDTVGIPNPQVQWLNAHVYQSIFNNLQTKEGRIIDVNAIDASSRVSQTKLSYALKLDDYNMLMIQTEMVPVSATVDTIRIQLLVMSVVVVVVASAIAHRVSMRVSTPVSAMTQSAQAIAQGDYNAEVSGSGFAEIEVLRDTLNAMRQDLKRVEVMRNELLANVSHDLRTPLTMIQGYVELMMDFPEEMNRDNLDVVAQEARRLKDMVQNLLDLSRVQTGLEPLRASHFDGALWLEENGDRYHALQPNLDIRVASDNALIYGDQTLLQQALDNLIQNALKHANRRVKLEGKRDGSTYRITIMDDGEGIEEQHVDQIWERYYTTNKDHTRGDKQYGLGLSIVKRIFEVHGLEYGYTRNEWGGSSFYFILHIEDV